MATIDRRRINGPPGGTKPPVFVASLLEGDSTTEHVQLLRPQRTRKDNELRKIFHGPRPPPRSSPFSPNLLLNTYLKFSPFATRKRRGYLRDLAERDLSVHLETALRGVIIADRWPKSVLDISVIVLEGEEDGWWGDNAITSTSRSGAAVGAASGTGTETGMSAAGGGQGWGLMTVLANAITVAGAAIIDAGVDCLGLISGGVASVVSVPTTSAVSGTTTPAQSQKQDNDGQSVALSSSSQSPLTTLKILLDPAPTDHPTNTILATAVVGYMPSSDELTEVWVKGNIPAVQGFDHEALIDAAVECAKAISGGVVAAAVRECAEGVCRAGGRIEGEKKEGDVEMLG
ncbi:3'-5'-exoribonuclease [Ascosphaera aggregata]|nr:3'-5'-exoribonuclease [Ascosphaera aggregata]